MASLLFAVLSLLKCDQIPDISGITYSISVRHPYLYVPRFRLCLVKWLQVNVDSNTVGWYQTTHLGQCGSPMGAMASWWTKSTSLQKLSANGSQSKLEAIGVLDLCLFMCMYTISIITSLHTTCNIVV